MRVVILSIKLALRSTHVGNFVKEVDDDIVKLLVSSSCDQTALDKVILITTLNLVWAAKLPVVVLIKGPSDHEGLEPIIYLDAIHILENAREKYTSLPNDSMVD